MHKQEKPYAMKSKRIAVARHVLAQTLCCRAKRGRSPRSGITCVGCGCVCFFRRWRGRAKGPGEPFISLESSCFKPQGLPIFSSSLVRLSHHILVQQNKHFMQEGKESN
jgi:hypothetical protein